MRILQLVTGEKWTGTAAVVFDQTAALVDAGIEAQFGFIGGSPLARRLASLGWARPILRRPRGPVRFVRDVAALRAILAREKFDLVHAHGTHDHFLAALGVGPTGARLVRTLHHVRHVRRGFPWRALTRRTHAFAFANRAIAAKFCGRGPTLAPVVDPDRFTPEGKPSELTARLGASRVSFLIGTVGKLAAGRGHEEAIRALAALPAGAGILHVGKGDEEKKLESLAASLSLADRNFWAGYQEEELPALFRSMHVFLFTASGSEQGQRAILEAMASGLPIVALDVPGVRDLVTEGEQGFVARDREGLVSGLRRLMEDPELRVRFGRRARMRARDFAPQKFAAAAQGFYESALSRAGRPGPSGRVPGS
ncbi:MAG: glycosyltransferase family 4 protein [Thermoanaerobaculia bacterium]